VIHREHIAADAQRQLPAKLRKLDKGPVLTGELPNLRWQLAERQIMSD
jgi:hypothetical protein